MENPIQDAIQSLVDRLAKLTIRRQIAISDSPQGISSTETSQRIDEIAQALSHLARSAALSGDR